MYIKHPELFKYSGDQTDKEWLAKANLMATTGGKAYLMVLRYCTNTSYLVHVFLAGLAAEIPTQKNPPKKTQVGFFGFFESK